MIAELHYLMRKSRASAIAPVSELEAKGPRPKVPTVADRRIELVKVLIEENHGKAISVADFAQAVNLSTGRLAHLFKGQVGTSLQQYLTDVRMKKAVVLLEDSVFSVKEIAAAVGIPKVSQFCRTFRSRSGLTPKEYRNRHLRIDNGKRRFLHQVQANGRH